MEMLIMTRPTLRILAVYYINIELGCTGTVKRRYSLVRNHSTGHQHVVLYCNHAIWSTFRFENFNLNVWLLVSTFI